MISIVMPSYNRQSYLAEAIESVLDQSYKDFELIICDDGSTDSSHRLYDYYTQKDKRVKVVYIPHGGIAKARNEGVRASQGEFIAVFDSDDIMGRDRLKNSLKAIVGHDFVYSSYAVADSLANVQHFMVPTNKVTIENIKGNDAWPHVTIMAKRELFENHPYRFDVNDDSGLVWDWFKAGYKAKMIKSPQMIVRIHPHSTSATKKKELDKVLATLKKEYAEWELWHSNLNQSQK